MIKNKPTKTKDPLIMEKIKDLIEKSQKLQVHNQFLTQRNPTFSNKKMVKI